MTRQTTQNRKTRSTMPFETLEGRQLMSASPYVVNGTLGNDTINVSYGMAPIVLAVAKAAPTVSNTAAVSTTTVATRSVSLKDLTIIRPPSIFNQLTVTVNGLKTTTTLQPGQQVIVNGLDGNDNITVSGVAVTVNGGNGNDTITTGSGNDTLNGDAGDDTLDGGMGADVINGGVGNDTVSYASRTQTVNVVIDGSANDGQVGEGDLVSTDIETIQGGWGNDFLGVNTSDTVARTFRGGYGDDTIIGGNGNDIIYGDAGVNDLYGGRGNDQIHGGNGVNFLHGGDGDDTLISIGGSHVDRQYGDGGTDNFWLDAESTECVMDANSYEMANDTHRVAGFEHLKVNGHDFGAPSREMNIGNLVDPNTTVHNPGEDVKSFGYKNFSNVPLFSSAGPSENDIVQGDVGDCYFMASLSGVAKVSPQKIRQSVVDLGDGTFAVQLRRDGVSKFVRVDADLPVTASGGTAFAHFASNKSLWAPIMEKAWAFFRNSTGSYQGTSGGFPFEAFKTLGMSNDSYGPHGLFGWGIVGDESPSEFGQHLCNLLSGGNVVTLCTDDGGKVLEKGHCYLVDHVNYSGSSMVSVTLRNPWGTDGPSADSVNDGYVTLSLQRALAGANEIEWGHV